MKLAARLVLLATSCVVLWLLAPLICGLLKEPRRQDYFLLVAMLNPRAV